MVNTVLGPIEANKLGRTLMHEHFVYGFCGWQGDITLGGWKEKEYFEENLKAIDIAKSYGVKTIVDATTNECGRNPEFYKHLADATGINIICSTGYYYEPESAYAYWHFRAGAVNVVDEIYEMYMAELTQGIGTSGIKAGVIKLATSYNQISTMEEKFLIAAARAQKDSGCAIITHTQTGTMGPEQAKILVENGANPKKIAIGHMCGNTSVEYHEEMLKYGTFDNFDRFGLEGELFKTPTDAQRCDTIAALVKKGYANRIVLGHDSVTVELGRPFEKPDFVKQGMVWAHIGNIGQRIIPMLKERGVTDADIECMLTANPRTIFE